MNKQVSSRPNPARKRPTRAISPGMRMLQRTHRRDLILLTGLIALACVSVLTVTFLVLRYQGEPEAVPTPGVAAVPGPQPTHTVTFSQVTGLSQYTLAETAAREWADDAQLASANTHWPKVVGKEHVGEPTLWTYRFYSPSKERLFFVNVDPEGQVQTIEHIAPITLPPQVIPAGSWLIDSPAALAIWLDYGGAQMLGNNPGMEILIQLRRLNSNPNPVWSVIGLNNQTEEIYRVVIDANQGVVTATDPGS